MSGALVFLWVAISVVLGLVGLVWMAYGSGFDLGTEWLVETLLFSGLIWGVGLAPPALTRFLFLKRPISKKPAFAITAALYMLNLFLCSAAAIKPPHILVVVAIVTYFILRRKNIWHYCVVGGREQITTEENLVEGIQSGRLPPDTFVWQKGMKDRVEARCLDLGSKKNVVSIKTVDQGKTARSKSRKPVFIIAKVIALVSNLIMPVLLVAAFIIEGAEAPVALVILAASINLWAILIKASNKALKSAAVLSSVFLFIFVWSYGECWPWEYLDNFLCAVGLVLLLACTLISVVREKPKLPAFLKETKEKNPHLLVAYGFAAALCILLTILIFVIAMK